MKRSIVIAFMSLFLFSAMRFEGCHAAVVILDTLLCGIVSAYYYPQDSTWLQRGQLYSIAVGTQGVILTRTGSPPADWVETQSGTTRQLNSVAIYDDPFESLSIAYALGDSGTVLYSTDGGHTWEDRSIPSLTQNLLALEYLYYDLDDIAVIVCGEGGTVYRSTNTGGWTWEHVATPTTRRLNTIVAYSSSSYLVAGDSGTILRSTDKGQSWSDVSVDGPNLNRVVLDRSQVFSNKAWIAGDSGAIYASTDYGASWGRTNSGTTENLYDMRFRTSYEGVAVGAHGVVKHTTNAGSTWNDDAYLSNLTDRDIVSLASADTSIASAITVNNYLGKARGRSSHDALLQSSDTTFILDVSAQPFVDVRSEEHRPSGYALEQNYPNPFNPGTTIAYHLPVASTVTLSVYDMQGREVSVLVHGRRDAGIHEVTIDARGLSSGVYFCKMQAGDFVQVRRLLLLQ